MSDLLGGSRGSKARLRAYVYREDNNVRESLRMHRCCIVQENDMIQAEEEPTMGRMFIFIMGIPAGR